MNLEIRNIYIFFLMALTLNDTNAGSKSNQICKLCLK